MICHAKKIILECIIMGEIDISIGHRNGRRMLMDVIIVKK